LMTKVVPLNLETFIMINTSCRIYSRKGSMLNKPGHPFPDFRL